MNTVKNGFLSALFVLILSLNAYGQHVDIVEIITTKKVLVKNDNGDLVERQMKIIERQTQQVATNPNEHHLLNQSVLNTPVKIVKTILVDNNNDSIYDTKTIVDYKVENNTIADLDVKTLKGSVSVERKIKEINKQEKDVYVLKIADISMVGYINKENDFVVETL